MVPVLRVRRGVHGDECGATYIDNTHSKHLAGLP